MTSKQFVFSPVFVMEVLLEIHAGQFYFIGEPLRKYMLARSKTATQFNVTSNTSTIRHPTDLDLLMLRAVRATVNVKRFLQDSLRSLRVPGVYLTWANSVLLPFFAFNGINNLRIFNVAFSSIPTAPTSFLFHFTGLAETARHQKAALRAGQRRRAAKTRAARMVGRLNAPDPGPD